MNLTNFIVFMGTIWLGLTTGLIKGVNALIIPFLLGIGSRLPGASISPQMSWPPHSSPRHKLSSAPRKVDSTCAWPEKSERTREEESFNEHLTHLLSATIFSALIPFSLRLVLTGALS